MATRNIVGARTLKGIASPGIPPPYTTFSIKSAPKNTRSAATPPVTVPTISEHLSIFTALLYLFFTNLADISLETAIGRPYEDSTSIILYTLNAVPYIPLPSLPIIFNTGILYTIPIILTNIPAIASMEP